MLYAAVRWSIECPNTCFAVLVAAVRDVDVDQGKSLCLAAVRLWGGER